MKTYKKCSTYNQMEYIKSYLFRNLEVRAPERISWLPGVIDKRNLRFDFVEFQDKETFTLVNFKGEKGYYSFVWYGKWDGIIKNLNCFVKVYR